MSRARKETLLTVDLHIKDYAKDVGLGFSTVRSNKNGDIGHLSNFRKLDDIVKSTQLKPGSSLENDVTRLLMASTYFQSSEIKMHHRSTQISSAIFRSSCTTIFPCDMEQSCKIPFTHCSSASRRNQNLMASTYSLSLIHI